MRVYYSDHYTIPLPDKHRFPMRKYRLLREALLLENILNEYELFQPDLASREDVLLAHTTRYVDAVLQGELSNSEIRRIGFPWSQAMVQRSLATVGGCYSSALAALEDGCSGNLAGGTHHAMPDWGEGYCVFNDIAIATKKLRLKGAVQRVAIIDLDVHHGNGNAEIFSGDKDTFVFSMHGEKNYPFRKPPSTIDIPLKDGTEDAEYLEQLALYLPYILDWQPDLVFYQCGVDPLIHDTLGRLHLSFAGLQQRDWLVLHSCKTNGIPVMLALGGGYAKPIELTIQAQCNTYRVAKHIFG